ncbi:MAG: DUF5677 domain-containing protein [Planctomycetota bacterium]
MIEVDSSEQRAQDAWSQIVCDLDDAMISLRARVMKEVDEQHDGTLMAAVFDRALEFSASLISSIKLNGQVGHWREAAILARAQVELSVRLWWCASSEERWDSLRAATAQEHIRWANRALVENPEMADYAAKVKAQRESVLEAIGKVEKMPSAKSLFESFVAQEQLPTGSSDLYGSIYKPLSGLAHGDMGIIFAHRYRPPRSLSVMAALLGVQALARASILAIGMSEESTISLVMSVWAKTGPAMAFIEGDSE